MKPLNFIRLKLFFYFSLFLPFEIFGQCANTISLTSTGNCLGSTLTAAPSDALSKIVWTQDGNSISTVTYQLGGYNPLGRIVAGGNGSGAAANQLMYPNDIYLDASGNIYVADPGNNRIQKWAPGATNGVTVAGGNGMGAAANQLDDPAGLYVDADGNIYISDLENDRIQKWAPGATSGITVAGGNGQGSADNQLAGPEGIYIDENGNIYIADYGNDRVQKWAPGAASGITVAGGNGYGTTANQLGDPTGVYVDASGNVYVADFNNDRVQKWSPGATIGITVAGGNGRGAAANQLTPVSLTLDGAGNIYISDAYGNRVQEWPVGATSGITVAGGNGSGAGFNQFKEEPGGLFIDGSGNIYVADEFNQRVLEFSLLSAINAVYLPPAAGTYTAMVTDNTGCTSTTNAVVIYPTVTPSVIIDPANPVVSACNPETFTATAVNGGNNPSYQWQINGANAGNNSAAYTDNNPANGDVVNCIMTSNAACPATPTVTSDPVHMVVNPGPAVNITAATSPACSGKPLNFTATVTNVENTAIYQWQVNGVNDGVNSPYYTDSHPVNGDIITCSLKNNDVCPAALSNSISLSVNASPFVDPGQVFSISQGQSAVLEPAISGDIATYSWSPSTGLSDASIRNPLAAPTGTTVYNLQVVTFEGCEASGDITVKVFTQLRLPNAFTPNGDGKNDIFYVMGGPSGTLIRDFSIFNRWGVRVFQVHDAAPGDPNYGWKGTYQGALCLPGAYVYVIGMISGDGQSQVIKGTVILVR